MSENGAIDPHKHPKQDFQVERLAFFSDAVFAIAITLLIIEFKVPPITKESTLDSVLEQLNELRPELFSLLISFYLIAFYWRLHHYLFKHIHNYNDGIVIANFFLLLPIIFFPFTSAFVATSLEHNPAIVVLSVRLFLINNITASLFMYVLYHIAIVRHKDFSFELVKKEKAKFLLETLFMTIAFVTFLAVTFITTNYDKITYALVAFALLKALLEKRIKMMK